MASGSACESIVSVRILTRGSHPAREVSALTACVVGRSKKVKF